LLDWLVYRVISDEGLYFGPFLLLGGFVDLLPRQWAPLGTTDAKHANDVTVDHE
jgi:hypothetical protein